MRRAGLFLVTWALAGAVALPAGAGAKAVLQLPLHGTAMIVGTHVLCGAGRSNGETFVDCGIPGPDGQPKKGGYVALIAASGKVSVAAVSTNKIVFNRIAGTMSRGSSELPVHSGDVFEIPGVKTILCSVSPIGGKPTVLCDRLNAKGTTQRDSYAFALSDTLVSALGWDTKGKVHVLQSWRENG